MFGQGAPIFLLPEIAHWLGIVPLAVLVGLRLSGRSRDVAWWWLAGAFAVSWLADTAAHWVDPDLVGNVYPITQSALIAAVLLSRTDALVVAIVLIVVGIVGALWRGPIGADVLLRTAAWLTVVGIVVDRWELGRLRTALLVTFGLGLVAWWGYALRPGWTSWGLYQSVRALGIGLFCAAAFRPVALRLSTRRRL